MLSHLSITDFAIIKHLDIHLASGLNILSGETGAGKSIIINAANLILGARASTDLVRSGCKEAKVEALFRLPEESFLRKEASELGFPFDGDLIIQRTVSREGRSRILINGSMVTLQTLSRLGQQLVSISGQNENQILLKQESHLFLLDDFGGLSHDRTRLTLLFDKYQSLTTESLRLEKEIQEIEEKQDLRRFQLEEIEQAEIKPGEDETLTLEKDRLQHAEELLSIVAEGCQALYEGNDSALSQVARYAKKVDRGASIDPDLGAVRDDLYEIEAKLEDITLSLREFQKTIQVDPSALEEVIERMELLNRLKRKYGPTLNNIFQFKERLASGMFDMEERQRQREILEGERETLEAEIRERAAALTEKRKEAGAQFEKAVEKELNDLHMAGTRFRVQLEQLHSGDDPKKGGLYNIGQTGADRVEFLLSPNVGEDIKPLAKIASGGELSRITLAMKTILARTASVETVIFDEVDSGISGATAEVVGEKLLSLGRYHQLLCITHLPQIARQGHFHLLVRKDVVDGRTKTAISELDHEGRVLEIARLLGGQEITPKALDHAREMLSA
ncbi:MAG: DNA repair protein RecN [Desulfatiglans sp.]|jgi:DNA repair protein RecN (Recombination protein N)|nr:DNA repair protein RecN [Thermodesulfobacteriota bacterium]MEE4351417.1 DNA repair protein RecN [Desulfatiglans sp.]